MQRPRISVNFAISADGKISSVQRKASGWTSREDHQRLLDLRKEADALLVGKGTLVADHMTMTVPEREKQPLRCIVSHSGEIPADHPVFRKPGGAIHLCVTGESPVSLPGVTVHHLSLEAFLEMLAVSHGVKHLHCEGGGELVHSLAELGVVDEFHATIGAHSLFGGKAAPTVTGVPDGFLTKTQEYELAFFNPRPDLGECFLSYRRKTD